jgi:hypothetical protein
VNISFLNLTISLNKSVTINHSFSFRIKIINYKKLNDKLHSINWSPIITDDANFSLETLINILQNEVNNCSYIKHRNHKKLKEKPWINCVYLDKDQN